MLSEKIKEATKSAHLNLEKLVVQQLKSIKNNEDYSNFLKKFYTYFSQVEKVISPYITTQLLPDYADRRNSSYLENDIEALGSDVKEIATVEVPKIDNEVSALGALYVMEGSIKSKVDDEKEKVFKTGESWSEKPGARHLVSGNASKTAPAKIFAVFVADETQKDLVIMEK